MQSLHTPPCALLLVRRRRLLALRPRMQRKWPLRTRRSAPTQMLSLRGIRQRWPLLARKSRSADFSTAKYMARIADALRAELIGVPAWQPTATVAASPGAAKVHATRPTMTAGPTVKLAAQAVPSGAQITKEGVAKARQDEHRQLTLEAKREVVLERHQVELQQVEAEHAGDLSDNGSSA